MGVPGIFRHGGCHVFAECLVQAFRYPLLRVWEIDGDHLHLACAPEGDVILDAVGWFSRLEYLRTDFLEGKKIRFDPTTIEKVRGEYTAEDGRGFYSHPSFMIPCTRRAEDWINRHRAHFDGTVREPIDIGGILPP